MNKLWRVIQPGGHFKLRDAQLMRFVPGFVIDLAQRLYVVGDESNRNHAHFAHSLGRQCF